MDALGLLPLIQSSNGSSFQILRTDELVATQNRLLQPPSGATVAIFLTESSETTPTMLYTAGSSATIMTGMNGCLMLSFEWLTAEGQC